MEGPTFRWSVERHSGDSTLSLRMSVPKVGTVGSSWKWIPANLTNSSSAVFRQQVSHMVAQSPLRHHLLAVFRRIGLFSWARNVWLSVVSRVEELDERCNKQCPTRMVALLISPPGLGATWHMSLPLQASASTEKPEAAR